MVLLEHLVAVHPAAVLGEMSTGHRAGHAALDHAAVAPWCIALAAHESSRPVGADTYYSAEQHANLKLRVAAPSSTALIARSAPLMADADGRH